MSDNPTTRGLGRTFLGTFKERWGNDPEFRAAMEEAESSFAARAAHCCSNHAHPMRCIFRSLASFLVSGRLTCAIGVTTSFVVSCRLAGVGSGIGGFLCFHHSEN
jgi:hypothetical protein